MVSTSKIVHDTLESNFEDNMDNDQEDSNTEHQSNRDTHTRKAPTANKKRNMLHQNTMTRYMVPKGRSNNERTRTNLITRYMPPRVGIYAPHDRSDSVMQRDAQQNRTRPEPKEHLYKHLERFEIKLWLAAV